MVMQTMAMPGEAVAAVPDDIGMEQRDQLLQPGWPVMAFIECRLAGDPTNWWAPNHACVLAMLRSSGFEVQARIADETYLCAPADPSAAAAMIAAERDAATGYPQGPAGTA